MQEVLGNLGLRNLTRLHLNHETVIAFYSYHPIMRSYFSFNFVDYFSFRHSLKMDSEKGLFSELMVDLEVELMS